MATCCINSLVAYTLRSMEHRKTVLECATGSFAYFSVRHSCFILRYAAMLDTFLYFYLRNFYFMPYAFAPGVIIRARFHFRDILYCVNLFWLLLHALTIPVFYY